MGQRQLAHLARGFGTFRRPVPEARSEPVVEIKREPRGHPAPGFFLCTRVVTAANRVSPLAQMARQERRPVLPVGASDRHRPRSGRNSLRPSPARRATAGSHRENWPPASDRHRARARNQHRPSTDDAALCQCQGRTTFESRRARPLDRFPFLDTGRDSGDDRPAPPNPSGVVRSHQESSGSHQGSSHHVSGVSTPSHSGSSSTSASISSSIRSAIRCAGPRSWRIVQSAA